MSGLSSAGKASYEVQSAEVLVCMEAATILSGYLMRYKLNELFEENLDHPP